MVKLLDLPAITMQHGDEYKAAVNRVIDDIEEMSDDYTQECFIGRFDYKSFFCSIDCKILKDLLTSFIEF